MFRFAWILLLLLLPLEEVWPAPAEVAEKPGYQKPVDDFFESVRSQKYEKAMADLLATNPGIAPGDEKWKKVTRVLTEMGAGVGPFNEFEVIAEKPFGKHIVYLMGFASFRRQPIRFKFIFYKSEKTWNFLSIQFGSEVTEAINKMVYLPEEIPQNPAASGTGDPEMLRAAQALMDPFFAKVKEGKFHQAVEDLLNTHPVMAADTEAKKRIEKALGDFEKKYGSFSEFEVLGSKSFGQKVIYVSGFAIYPTQPVHIEFVFIKSGDKWELFNVSYETDSGDEVNKLAGEGSSEGKKE